MKIKRVKDVLLNLITYLFSSFGLVVLVALLIFIFNKGIKGFSFKMLTSDYYQSTFFAKCSTTSEEAFSNLVDTNEIYYSKVWGIGLQDSLDYGNNKVVKIVYIDNLSPLKRAVDHESGEVLKLEVGHTINRIMIYDSSHKLQIVTASKQAKAMALGFDAGYEIEQLYYTSVGGGIRGSLITTLYLILLTLIIALPIGVIAAIYLSVYAPKNKMTNLIRTFIDMTSGIPSIIFGLVAMAVFIPFVNKVSGSSGGSILSGALTLSIMLLPIIIRTTEEAIHTIPKGYTSASLALGASQSQTTFKIILPNAIPGILTSTLLAIGRIIGESAALIFAIGTSIQDVVQVNGSSTSLAVHIWSVMSGDNPNYSQACAISIVILFVVLVLNVLVKLISKKLNKFEVK